MTGTSVSTCVLSSQLNAQNALSSNLSNWQLQQLLARQNVGPLHQLGQLRQLGQLGQLGQLHGLDRAKQREKEKKRESDMTRARIQFRHDLDRSKKRISRFIMGADSKWLDNKLSFQAFVAMVDKKIESFLPEAY